MSGGAPAPPVPPAALPDWLAHRAASAPAHPALVAGGRTWSHRELDAAAGDAARRLRTLLGGAAGAPADGAARVATLLRNGADAALLAHAAPRAAATLVPLNVRLGAAELV